MKKKIENMDGGEGRGRKSRNIRHSGHRLESDRERTFRGPPPPPHKRSPLSFPPFRIYHFHFRPFFFRSNIRCSRHFLVPVFFSFQIVFQSVLVLFCFFFFFFFGGGGVSVPSRGSLVAGTLRSRKRHFFTSDVPRFFFCFLLGAGRHDDDATTVANDRVKQTENQSSTSASNN